MEFHLTETQKILKNTAKDFLLNECPLSLVRDMFDDPLGYPPELWNKMAKLGWLGLIIPEKYGGAGGDFFDLTVLIEEMGRGCMPAPYFPHVISSFTLLEAASEIQRQELLPGMATGDLIVTPAIFEDGLSYEASAIQTIAVPTTNGYSITGKKIFVQAAHVANRFLVVARTNNNSPDGLTLFIVDAQAKGIQQKQLVTVSGEKQFELSFNAVPTTPADILGAVGKAWEYLKPVQQKAAVVKCTEMLGAAEWTLETTVEYAKTRRQFGKYIGSFQAIQHHCANMSIDFDSLRLLTYQAAWMISQGLPCSKQVSMAKAWVSEAYRRIDSLGHQVHGGIAVIENHDLPLFTKRSLAAEVIFGDADHHRELVAREIGL